MTSIRQPFARHIANTAEQVPCEEARFVSSRAGANLQNGVPAVLRIARDERHSQFFFERRYPCLDRIELCSSEVAHLRVGLVRHHRAEVVPLQCRRLISIDDLDD
jgi:hypothetical protein